MSSLDDLICQPFYSDRTMFDSHMIDTDMYLYDAESPLPLTLDHSFHQPDDPFGGIVSSPR